jgi:tripartite-type tricarboxylate transporter receptor subunit TctC
MKFICRAPKVLILALGLALLHTAVAFAADGYPARPVTLINPYAAGSSTDLMARTLALTFQKSLGQPFVVVNRPGGSGVTGITALVNAPPDGLTLAYSPLTPLTIQPHMLASSKLGPGAVTPICGVAENILGIAVRKDSHYRTVADLIGHAHVAPPSYGSPGANSGPSLGVDDLARNQRVSFVHVPFQGDAPSIQELLAGRLDFAAVVVASVSAFVKSGAVRLLAVMSEVRHPDYPDVATLQEQGFPVKQLSYTAIFAPKGTPASIVDTLDRNCMNALQSDDLRGFARKNEQVLHYLPHDELEKQLAEQYQLQGERLRASGAIK